MIVLRSADDSGESVAQTVLVVPVVLSIVWLALQVTVFLHGAHVAAAAASEGAAAASRYGASTQTGVRAAASTLIELDAEAATPPEVVRRGDDIVATVSVRLPRIAPLFSTVVTRSARETKERFITEAERNS